VSSEFTAEQKRYLEGFLSGAQAMRGGKGAAPHDVAHAPFATLDEGPRVRRHDRRRLIRTDVAHAANARGDRHIPCTA
jgi:hypothetical protein